MKKNICQLDFTDGRQYKDDVGRIWTVEDRELKHGFAILSKMYPLSVLLEFVFVEVDEQSDPKMKHKKDTIKDNDPYSCPFCKDDSDTDFIENIGQGVERYFCNSCSNPYTVLYSTKIYDVLEG